MPNETVLPSQGGLYRIQVHDANLGLCLELQSPGNDVVVAPIKEFNLAQMWSVNPSLAGTYKITSFDGKLVLTIQQDGPVNNVVAEEAASTMWKITSCGSYAVISVPSAHGELFLDRYERARQDPKTADAGRREPGREFQEWVFKLELIRAGTANPQPSMSDFQRKYFTLTIDEALRRGPYDIIIIGSGFGGGVLAADIFETNSKIGDSAKKVLLIEKGNLVFHTHCLNTSRPSSGRTGRDQFNHHFYSKFKDSVQVTDSPEWGGGPVYGVGGRGAIWSLATPRIHDKTLRAYFPTSVADELVKEYYQKAEQVVKLFMPTTRQEHQEYIDRLNFKADGSLDVSWQWARIGSNLREESNFDFAKGAYSPIDKLLEIAMNTSEEENPHLNILLGAEVRKINWMDDSPTKAKGVNLKVPGNPVGIDIDLAPGGRLVVSAGSIQSAAILLRSNVRLDLMGGLHVTDHTILYKNVPYQYRNPRDREVIRSMKLQTYMNLEPVRAPITALDESLDSDTALEELLGGLLVDYVLSSTELLGYKDLTLVNLYIDSAPFLSRGETFSPDDIPAFVMIFVMRTPLLAGNSIKLDENTLEPIVTIRRSQETEYDEKKEAMKKFSQEAMEVTQDVLKVDFLPEPAGDADYFKELDLGAGGHEMGSIPMASPQGSTALEKRGCVDDNLKLRRDTENDCENVYVCDLSVFPYSPEANPSLTLTALALRLSQHLLPRLVEGKDDKITVVNHSDTQIKVTASEHIALPDSDFVLMGDIVEIEPGKDVEFDATTEEAVFVYKRLGQVEKPWVFSQLYIGKPKQVLVIE